MVVVGASWGADCGAAVVVLVEVAALGAFGAPFDLLEGAGCFYEV